MRYFSTVVSLISGASCFMLYEAGQAWITEGFGINPLLAGASIVVMLVVPFAVTAMLNTADAIGNRRIKRRVSRASYVTR